MVIRTDCALTLQVFKIYYNRYLCENTLVTYPRDKSGTNTPEKMLQITRELKVQTAHANQTDKSSKNLTIGCNGL